MLKIALCCVLVAMVAADCGPLQRIKVKTQWAQAYSQGRQREAFGQAVWRAIFAMAPESRDLFVRVHGDDVTSPEFNAHALRVLGGLDMTMSLLDDEGALQAQLTHLQGQHRERGIPQQYFEVFGKVLMQVVPASLGRCFDQDAWTSCYQVIAQGIKH